MHSKNYLIIFVYFIICNISAQTFNLNGTWAGAFSITSDYNIYLDITQNNKKINGILKVEYKWVGHGESNPFVIYKISGNIDKDKVTFTVLEKLKDAMNEELKWCTKNIVGKIEYFNVGANKKLKIMGKRTTPKKNTETKGFGCTGSFYFIKDNHNFNREVMVSDENVIAVNKSIEEKKESPIQLAKAENPPQISGCEGLEKKEALKCLRDTITTYIETHPKFPKEIISQSELKNFWIVFEISKDKLIKNIRFNHDNIDNDLRTELSRIISSIPITEAANSKGEKVGVNFELILKFETNYSQGVELITTKNNSIRNANLLLSDKPKNKLSRINNISHKVYWYTLFNKNDQEIANLTNSYYDFKYRYSFYLPDHERNWIEIVLQNPTDSNIKILKSPDPIISLYSFEGDKTVIKPRSQKTIKLRYNKDYIKSDVMTLLAEIRTQNEKMEYIIYSLFINIAKQK